MRQKDIKTALACVEEAMRHINALAEEEKDEFRQDKLITFWMHMHACRLWLRRHLKEGEDYVGRQWDREG